MTGTTSPAKIFVWEEENPGVTKADAVPMIRGRLIIDFMVGYAL